MKDENQFEKDREPNINYTLDLIQILKLIHNDRGSVHKNNYSKNNQSQK